MVHGAVANLTAGSVTSSITGASSNVASSTSMSKEANGDLG